MKKNYVENLKWAVIYMIDRSTQDYHRSKAQVEALFRYPMQAEENYRPANKEFRRYIVNLDNLEEFENVYNGFQDLREKYGDRAIYHLGDLHLGCDLENKYRQILGVYTSIDF